MMLICEPSCKNFSHEKINEGFLYLASITYPKEKILFLGHKSHIKILKKSLNRQKISLSNIEFIHIQISSNNTIKGFILNFILIHKLSSIIKKNKKIKKILFLSYSKCLIYILKKIKKISVNKYFVLHGELEELNQNKNLIKEEYVDLPKVSNYKKIKSLNLQKVKNKINSFLIKTDLLDLFFKKKDIKNLIFNCKKSDFSFITISDHIIINLKKIKNLDMNFIKTINFPQIQEKYLKERVNKNVKFGVFGYGNSKLLYNLNLKLKDLNIKKKYEIKVIGMDNRGIESFKWTNAPSKGKTLKREEMEELLVDIDFILILYPENTYVFSCSASIIEAISNKKPIIHLKNDCISFYNKNQEIGYEVSNLNQMARLMKKIIYKFPNDKVSYFMQNIDIKRKLIDPRFQTKNFKKIFN